MSCPYYTFKSDFFFGGDYFCKLLDKPVSESIYSNYCKNYSYSDCSIYRKENPSSGCFVTTVVCDILNKEDDCYVLNNLRSFRDNVLQKDKKYHEYLQDYDNIGPVISDNLYNDEDRYKLASVLYNNAIMPISNLIDEKKYEDALEKYHIMLLLLINYYGLKHTYNLGKDSGEYSTNFDLYESGHGRVLKKVNNSV